jgi:hypothetical protein
MGSVSQFRNAIFDCACLEFSNESWGNPRLTWGYPVEISALRCGKVGVTPWKNRGNPTIEFEHFTRKLKAKMWQNSRSLFDLGKHSRGRVPCHSQQNLAHGRSSVIYCESQTI